MTMEGRFRASIEPPAERDGPAFWFAFRGREVLVLGDDGMVTVPRVGELGELGLEPLRAHYLGSLSGTDCYSAELAEGLEPPKGSSFRPLRSLFGVLADELFAVAGRAAQIVEWDRTHQFCGRCGQRTEPSPGERARRCPDCGLIAFPRLSPAIIVLIERGEEFLLGRSHGWAPGTYSALAGFVEPGESLEEAVEREIDEEVGIRIRDVRYFGSQPWPYPHSLMIGFRAAYEGGELRVDENELEDARWFTPERLPDALPGKLSIARRLIDAMLAERGIVVTDR
jgi:NAD+ diphosphatase